jgi:class 3 adenylate cyclase
MIPTSSPVEKWLLHVVGDQELRPKEGMRRLTEAVELNTEAPQILSTFGRKEFEGMVGFVDMQGFSSHAQGKSPREVLAIAQPFVDAVVDVAKKRQWLVDKTIGDEVMVVCPLYGDDAHLAEVDLLARDDPIIEAANLVSDILVRFRTDHIADHISAGFACGRLLLARVGTSEYGEWTCYGNAVNTAKRLQGVPRPGDANGTHWLLIG